MDTEEKTCKNCAHYLQHYGCPTNCFIPVNCGHCLKHTLTKRERARLSMYDYCDEWEPREKEIAIRKENLKETLTDMAKRIDEIKMMLDNDFLNS